MRSTFGIVVMLAAANLFAGSVMASPSPFPQMPPGQYPAMPAPAPPTAPTGSMPGTPIAQLPPVNQQKCNDDLQSGMRGCDTTKMMMNWWCTQNNNTCLLNVDLSYQHCLTQVNDAFYQCQNPLHAIMPLY